MTDLGYPVASDKNVRSKDIYADGEGGHTIMAVSRNGFSYREGGKVVRQRFQDDVNVVAGSFFRRKDNGKLELIALGPDFTIDGE